MNVAKTKSLCIFVGVSSYRNIIKTRPTARSDLAMRIGIASCCRFSNFYRQDESKLESRKRKMPIKSALLAILVEMTGLK